MGKRVDLNAPRNSNEKKHKIKPNVLPRHNAKPHNNNNEQENQNDNDSMLQNSDAAAALKDAKNKLGNFISNQIGNSKGKKGLFTSGNEKVQGTLKMPSPIMIKFLPVILIAGVILLLLMIFIILIGGDFSSSGSSGSGSYTYGKTTCTKVNVENTDCNINGENCTNKYNGEVDVDKYIAGVVAAEVGIVNNLEYYKVAAIAARTYYFNNANDSCTVNGNATFQAYMDVEDSENAELIKQAVEETDDLVLVKDGNLSTASYASACVVNADDEYYYIRYGTSSLGEPKFQEIPKEWDENESAFSGYLANWYALVDQSSTDYDNKDCPNNHDYGMSQIGALYLVTNENYSYDEVIKYYYGEDVEIMKNSMQLSGAEGFINPTRYIKCSSPFGNRTHPMSGETEFHTGLDIAISGGEPIYAASNGIVRTVINNVSGINSCEFGYGNYIIIDHTDGMSTLYAHIKYGSIPDSIQIGSTVSQGEEIGQVGSTGCSTGNHLHYEVRQNNSQVDPTNYIDLTGATGTCQR